MLGTYIRDIRIQNKKSVRQLAEESGVSKSYIDFIENGDRVPSLEVCSKIAEALGIPMFMIKDLWIASKDTIDKDSFKQYIEVTGINSVGIEKIKDYIELIRLKYCDDKVPEDQN